MKITKKFKTFTPEKIFLSPRISVTRLAPLLLRITRKGKELIPFSINFVLEEEVTSELLRNLTEQEWDFHSATCVELGESTCGFAITHQVPNGAALLRDDEKYFVP